jgi:hypothetical protein
VGCLGGYLGGRLHLVSLRVPVRIEQEGDYPEPPRRLTHQRYNNLVYIYDFGSVLSYARSLFELCTDKSKIPHVRVLACSN